MNKFLNHNHLNQELKTQYINCVSTAFPKIILQSELVQTLWSKVENYFPQYQRSLVDENNNLIGVINTIPFYWDKSLAKLPDEGWDWLMQKGISDYESNISPNSLGGLQIIVTKENQGKSLSKILIAEGKTMQSENNLTNFVIPIRPTFKHKHPEMPMTEYINLKSKGEIFDPWIRTHIKSGAQIIKVCPNSMHIFGNVKMWESLSQNKITQSGNYIIEGALNPVFVNVPEDFGEYKEDNIWISYGKQ